MPRKGESSVKRAGHILLGLCFALLLLLGGQTLIEGPDTAVPPALPPLPQLPDACLAASVDASAQTADALLANQHSALRRYAVREDTQARAPVMSPVCDRNGWPVISRSYARTVYTVCPLEDMPG